jgi:DNA-binding beta-propeller fold protein YncE
MIRLRPLLGLLAALALVACEPTSSGPAPGSSPASGPIAISQDDAQILVASEDHGELLLIDRERKVLTGRVATGRGAAHVLQVTDDLAVVSNRYAHSISVVNVDTGALVATHPVGVEPYGLAKVDDDTVAVVLSGEEALVLVALDSGEILARADLGQKDPRAVARLDNGSFLITHMIDGLVSKVAGDLTSVSTHDITRENAFGPTTHPNHLRSITVDTTGDSVFIAHSQANADTVRAPIGEGGFDEFGGDSGACGYSGCAQELGAVVPALTQLNADSVAPVAPVASDVDANDPFFDDEPREAFVDCFDCGGDFFFFRVNPPDFLNPFENRFNGVDLNNPTAVALIDGGHGSMVVHMGTKNVLILRRDLQGTADDVVGSVSVGHGATGIALSHDGRFAYVWNQFDGSVTEIEVPDLTTQPENQSGFVEEGPPASRRESAEFRRVRRFVGDTTVVVDDALTPEASLGRKLFHDATDSRISENHAISCASCHPDGRTDGRTWQFTFGPRNTPQLGGAILETAPFHWPGDVETHRELNSMTVLAFMGGMGLDERSMDAIGAFIDTIPAAPSRASVYGLSDAEQRGRDLFTSTETRCTECHYGEHFTDNRNWDVDTRATSADIDAFQTPVLHGLSRSGPYLHDGSALTVRQMLEELVATDRMGQGSHLTSDQLDDLAAYLLTL